MIIFDLDGTLADCEHRRHYVDMNHPYHAFNLIENFSDLTGKEYRKQFKPNWEAFFESCDEDDPIQPVIDIWNDQISLGMGGAHQIWSGRCESVREKTIDWLRYHLIDFHSHQLRMRPIGDCTPDDELKERWLKEALEKGEKIEAVFDDRPKVVRMWRLHGIFVFDCNQTGKEF